MSVVEPSSPNVVFATHASGSWGCGAVWGNHWLQWKWEGYWSFQQIAVREMVQIVAACAIWGRCWENLSVVVECDNMSVVQVLSSLSSRDPTLMHLLRYFLALYNIQLRAVHVLGGKQFYC